MPKGDKSPSPWPRPVQALVQSLFMGLFVLVAFFVFFGIRAELAIASLGASSFIAFYFPNANASRPRYLLGGYACGVAGGLLCNLALFYLMPPQSAQNIPVNIVFCALAVFITGFLMSLLNLQHPPAAAFAISMVIHPHPFYTAALVFCMVILLTGLRGLIHRGLGRYFQ